MRALVAAVALCSAACHHADAPAGPATAAVVVPSRAATAGDALLARLPAGADVLVEVDLARLRKNPTVGELATRALADPRSAAALCNQDLCLATPLARADTLVLASYHVGTAQAATITLVAGGGVGVADVPHGVDLGGGVIASAPPEAIARLTADGPHLDGDDDLRALRARAMPPRADGATVRLTARLGFDARVSLASQLGLEAVPAAVSLWGDVADDLAIVADLDAPDDGPGTGMTDLAARWKDDLSGAAPIVALGLAPAAQAIEIQPRGTGVRVVALVGPRHLSRVVLRAKEFLELSGSGSGSGVDR